MATRLKKHTLFHTKRVNYALSPTKNVKTIPFGTALTYIAHIRE